MYVCTVNETKKTNRNIEKQQMATSTGLGSCPRGEKGQYNVGQASGFGSPRHAPWYSFPSLPTPPQDGLCTDRDRTNYSYAPTFSPLVGFQFGKHVRGFNTFVWDHSMYLAALWLLQTNRANSPCWYVYKGGLPLPQTPAISFYIGRPQPTSCSPSVVECPLIVYKTKKLLRLLSKSQKQNIFTPPLSAPPAARLQSPPH